MAWTDEMIAVLVAMRNLDRPFSEIANRITAQFPDNPVTRNACISRAQRLTPDGTPFSKAPRPKRRYVPISERLRRLQERRELRPPPRKVRDVLAGQRALARMPALPSAPTKSLMALREGDCRWPFGDSPNIRFCAQPAAHGSYCEHHARLAYREPRTP